MTDVDTRIVSSGEDGTHRKNKQTKPKPNQKNQTPLCFLNGFYLNTFYL